MAVSGIENCPRRSPSKFVGDTQNVTYVYTGASFSGRMPCVEIADDIVQTGRETLEKVIRGRA